MKKIAVLMLVTISMLSCNKPNPKIDYATILDNCFSTTEIEILNDACTLFESQLTENYPEETIVNKYKLFLKDISLLNEPAPLMQNTSQTFLTNLKNSSVFDKIWSKYSETYYEDDSFETQAITNSQNIDNETASTPKDFYITNPKGAYLECLINNKRNQYVNEYLMAIKDIGDMSPQIVAQGFLNSLKELDYDDKTVRLVIALNLFYELQLNITE